MLKKPVYIYVFIATLSVAPYVVAADLALKYDFVPKREQLYSTSIVQHARTVKPIPTSVIFSPASLSNVVQPNVQVVAARNYPNKQPLAPTISYSYSAPSSSMLLASHVVPAKNYYERVVEITSSDLAQDYLQTFVVGTTYKSAGFSQESKSDANRVQAAIDANPLSGCAPLNINCSRTASIDKQLTIKRNPVKVTPQKQKKQRQLLNP